jgi:hypothetical protein
MKNIKTSVMKKTKRTHRLSIMLCFWCMALHARVTQDDPKKGLVMHTWKYMHAYKHIECTIKRLVATDKSTSTYVNAYLHTYKHTMQTDGHGEAKHDGSKSGEKKEKKKKDKKKEGDDGKSDSGSDSDSDKD